MSILIPATPTGGPTVTLEALQVLEKLGGSEGYLEHIQSPPTISAREVGKSVDVTGWKSVLCEMKTDGGCFSAWADLLTLDWHGARLEGWGFSTQYLSSGRLFYNDWEEFLDKKVDFTCVTGEDGEPGRLAIWFSIDTRLVAKYVAREPYTGPTQFRGTCTWENYFHTTD